MDGKELHRQSLRVINDRLSAGENGSLPMLENYVCECGDITCWETVPLSAAAYAAFRSENEREPLLAPKHKREPILDGPRRGLRFSVGPRSKPSGRAPRGSTLRCSKGDS
jgi:hypothetical protein